MRNNLWVGQIGLFTRDQLVAMRDRTRRRNYSAEAEKFRREHEKHREWGLAQRHARKLTRLYGSTADAAGAFQRRADELTCPCTPARTLTPTSSESAEPEPPASAPALPEQVGPEQVGPEQAEQECVTDAASPSGGRSGNTGRCPDHRVRSGRHGRRHPRRQGRYFGPATKGTHRPESARHARTRTDPESPENQPRRTVGPTGAKNAYRPRRTRTGRTTSPPPKYSREHIPP